MAQVLEESFDTPQFFDFNKIVNEDEDDFDNEYFDQLEDAKLTSQSCFRRSMSVGDLHTISSNLHKLRHGKYTLDVVEDNLKYGRTSSVRATSQETINRLAQPKRHKSNQNTNEYVPMAEALQKFLTGTPKRFRTKPISTSDVMCLTVAHTPKLQTAVRNRPIYAMSQREKEELALEEAKKSQFKANPLNKKVFKSPVQNIKEKKATVPEPFKLTEPSKKVSLSPIKKVPEFHARPVPKYIYEHKQPTIKPSLTTQITKAQTPTFMKRYTRPANESMMTKVNIQNLNETSHNSKLKPTKPIPFSFEMRDKMILSKREVLVQKVLEGEKKAREFHAKPVPKSILEKTSSCSMRSLGSSNGSQKNLYNFKTDDNMNTTTFKAQPPIVLYKKPFEPIKPNRFLKEINEFTLNTDIRKKERENFERQLKEKEEKVRRLRKNQEIIRKQHEDEEIQRARKLAEFKAHDVKKYKNVKIVPCHKVTNPVSPKFLSNRHKNISGNKEN